MIPESGQREWQTFWIFVNTPAYANHASLFTIARAHVHYCFLRVGRLRERNKFAWSNRSWNTPLKLASWFDIHHDFRHRSEFPSEMFLSSFVQVQQSSQSASVNYKIWNDLKSILEEGKLLYISSVGEFLREIFQECWQLIEFFKCAGYSSELSNESWRVLTFEQGRKYTDNTVVGHICRAIIDSRWKCACNWYIPLERRISEKKGGKKKKEKGNFSPHRRSLIKHFPMFWNNQIITINPRKQRKWKLYLSPFDRGTRERFFLSNFVSSSVVNEDPNEKQTENEGKGKE